MATLPVPPRGVRGALVAPRSAPVSPVCAAGAFWPFLPLSWGVAEPRPLPSAGLSGCLWALVPSLLIKSAGCKRGAKPRSCDGQAKAVTPLAWLQGRVHAENPVRKRWRKAAFLNKASE